MSDDYVQMREFIEIALSYSNDSNEPEILQEDVVSLFKQEETTSPLISDLEVLVSKLRGHLEDDENQEKAEGVEIGMNRAADMIENLLRQYGENQIG